MTWPQLHHTLTQLVDGMEPPDGTGLRVDAVEMTLPLEATIATSGDELMFLARVPHSRWDAGFLPPVHLGHLVIDVTPTSQVEGVWNS